MDGLWMMRTMQLSLQGRTTTYPNPWVGCTIVHTATNRVVAEGYHHKAGENHAERNAILSLEDKEILEECTLYVTLEPCNHTGRTPPCTDLILQYKIPRVIYGVQDPDTRVAGTGVQKLRDGGVEVTQCDPENRVRDSLAPYLYWKVNKRPFVIAKLASSINGLCACADNTSQWITCEEARKDSHELRAQCQAIIVGARTVEIDKPLLTVRNVEGGNDRLQPLRVVLDSSGRSRITSPALVFSNSSSCNPVVWQQWLEGGLQVIDSPSDGDRIDLEYVIRYLSNRYNIMQILIEGGPTLVSYALRRKVVQQLVVYTGPMFLGMGGLKSYRNTEPTTMTDIVPLKLQDVQICGQTVKAVYGCD